MRQRGKLIGATSILAAVALAAAGGAAERENPAASSVPTCHGLRATFVGTDGRDRVVDNAGKDPKLGPDPVLVLRGGNDIVDLAGHYAAIRTLTICAGRGKDRVELFERIDAGEYWVDGGRGDDKLGNSSPYIEESFLEGMTLRGGGGDDLLFGGSLAEKIVGGGGADRVEAGNGDDEIGAGGGRDHVFGEGHDDELLGNQGNDRLIGDSRFYQSGDDRAKGGAGNDRCDAERTRGCERFAAVAR